MPDNDPTALPQILEIGDVIGTGPGAIEVSAVSYRENDEGVRSNYAYTCRNHDEMNAERAESNQVDEVPIQ